MGEFLKSDELGIANLLSRTKANDRQAFAQLLTWVDSAGPRAVYECEELFKTTRSSFKIGITGPPGAGKSTLIGRLIGEFRKRNLKVGVLAVDPSSPFSRGAILGDRIRYADHFTDPNVFIRSVGTRGSLGGLSASAYLMLHAFDYADFDLVIIETVGVGQTELEIIHVADVTAVVLVPESGDSIQAMKAGLTEIGDVFIVNKSDRPGAEALLRELQAQFAGDENPPLCLLSSATQGKGVDEIADAILRLEDRVTEGKRVESGTLERLRREAFALLRTAYEKRIEDALQNVGSREDVLRLLRRLEQFEI